MTDRIDTDRLRADYHTDDPAPGVLPGDIARLCDEVDRLRAQVADLSDWVRYAVGLSAQVADWRDAVVALDALMAHPDHATREALDQWRSITRTMLARYPEEGNDE